MTYAIAIWTDAMKIEEDYRKKAAKYTDSIHLGCLALFARCPKTPVCVITEMMGEYPLRGTIKIAKSFVQAKKTDFSEPEESSDPGEPKQHRALTNEMEYLNRRKLERASVVTTNG